MKLADLKSDSVRRWVEQNPSPTFNNNKTDNNNTIDLVSQTFWRHQGTTTNNNNKQQPKEAEMPMLLQQPPSHHHALHEADQPLDFTMSKFKTKTATKQFHQQMMLLQNNGLYFNRTTANSGYSSPSSSSEEEGVGPPPPPPPPPQVTSPPPSPGPPHADGESLSYSVIWHLHHTSGPLSGQVDAWPLCKKSKSLGCVEREGWDDPRFNTSFGRFRYKMCYP